MLAEISVFFLQRAVSHGTALFLCWQRCSQSRKLLIDGCDTQRLVLSELCQPSARFVVIGPLWSLWFHMLGGRFPNIHVFLKYIAKTSNLRLVAISVFGGGERGGVYFCFVFIDLCTGIGLRKTHHADGDHFKVTSIARLRRTSIPSLNPGDLR